MDLSGDLPEEVLDFKRALRNAINNSGYRNLGQLTKATGIPSSTLSDATGDSLKLPTSANLSTILQASKSRAPGDGRYDTWKLLFDKACAAAKAAPPRVGTRRELTREPELPDHPVQSTAPPLPDHKPYLVLEDRAKGLYWYSFSEASAGLLITSHYPPSIPEPPEACDE